jgi:hypothetical protein
MRNHREAAPAGAEGSARRVVADASIPDTLLPDQYFDRLAARACDTPEKRLMFAVLLDAVIQLQRRGSPGASEAESWVRGEGVADDAPCSFANVCEALGLDPAYLARGLLALRAASASATRVPVRQLRTSHRRVTPVVRRRRRAASA